MNNLLNHAIQAHGGLDRWNAFSTLSAHLSQGGVIWPLKGKGGMLDEVDIRIQLHQPWTSHSPFGAPERRTAVTPQQVRIETAAGAPIEETLAPRASFDGHQLDTPWSDLQLAYFVGYAIWNYFTMPFTLARPGFAVTELAPWQENGQVWQRLQVTFPADVATHSPVQTFYFSADGLLRRHDYEVAISGGAPAVHYLSEHVTVQGITLPTKHLIYVRDADGGHQPEPLVVSIHASAIRFA
ncbi:hypothetical protein GJ697_04200 [Pseudoduganella sp. FT25W]|uniref:Uncharacterized protein n=1 Tax=Duganella alba TaxID=2666081 RepID=A0A6L5QB86_9BURK|nr:hypothetical protein [Duganella alba]MRX07033.1 hypothetical protein [Duganella alba]MRX16070.1 hypothetical protein [Duganella alba]